VLRNFAILYPMFALAAWTTIVLLMIPVVRIRAALRREVRSNDFRFGESAAVPGQVSLPNRNYMNLLELPMLFYVVCLILFVTAGTTNLAVAVAWAYVALRIVHSLIHLTYTRVMHRLTAFAISSTVLALLWVLAALHLAANPLA
jgi:hypothetical protein